MALSITDTCGSSTCSPARRRSAGSSDRGYPGGSRRPPRCDRSVPQNGGMAPELRHLRHFVAVAEELNITRAAGRLFLAQQALSSSIKQLENELGQPLFVRDTRRVALTPAGETLLPRARRMLTMAEETVAAVRDGAPDRALLRVD